MVSKAKNSKFEGYRLLFFLLFIAIVTGIGFFFVYMNSMNKLTKSFSKMQEIGKTATIEECAQKNIEFYSSCDAMTLLCDQSVSRMMRVCLVNGSKDSQCDKYGEDVFGYNFGAEECRPYYTNRSLKKACADTYQSIADFCKAVRKSK